MNTIDLIQFGNQFREEYDHPTTIFQDDGHSIHWLGVPEATACRSNTYLIVDHDEAILVDPGGVGHFEFIRNRVAQILPPQRVTGLVLSRPDPDVAASFPLWVELNPAVNVFTSSRALPLLNHYRDWDFNSVNVIDHPEFQFISGRSVRFIPSPFLPSPGAFTTWDPFSKFLFSGAVWSAVDIEWTLVVEEFRKHQLKLNLYHLDVMASGKAARGFAERIKGMEIHAILPNHGSIIPAPFVPMAIDYLKRLNCGTDIMYPTIN